ncbi:MAG: type II toxin-antitoxin system prevent-host-death family antitoxin, partial [Bifidobacteriaceae bacterium]|jgi:prevent-host-death family protein|nr:type II toxin-antitoxin system prevent-host-death family antitoxin [Bifidobacteriaceae bacterium]
MRECGHKEELMNVGVRELRDSLSRYLGSVQDGHTITVTDHGRPVARLSPISAPTKLEQLIAEGKVTPARRHRQPLPPLVQAAGTVSDLVADQRR